MLEIVDNLLAAYTLLTIIAQIVTLDDVLGAVGVISRRVGVIAIDVQGVEGRVLRGAKEVIQRHRPIIMYEDTELHKEVSPKGACPS